MAEGITDFKVVDPPIQPFQQLPKCKSGNSKKPDDCLTIGYGIIGKQEPWIDYVMQHVAYMNGLEFGKDVRLISRHSSASFYEYLK